MSRRPVICVLVAVFTSMGASYRTTNFMVHAPTPQVAQQVGQYAEHYRKQKAIEWLGYEMPNWPQPCPLYVQVSMDGPSGATSFVFAPQGGVASQKMEIQGPLDRLLNSVLPHEITHTVFAFYFRRPVPRWADEGGAVLSEDDIELDRHDKLVRQILNHGQQFQLRRLLSLTDYPPQRDKVMCLYAQGFSLAHYLVYLSDRQKYLGFVNHGMTRGWDSAAHSYYGFRTIEELEGAWLKHLKDTKGMSIIQLAKNKTRGQQLAQVEPAKRTVVRVTLPPAEPLEPTPIYRGVAATPGQDGQRFGDVSPPGYLPRYQQQPLGTPAQTWQPSDAPRVQLLPPESGPPPAMIGQPMPVVPPGFPPR
ncbi:MAG TPA: hypothetical protein VEL76_30740 [Gemmataceae bacterium]|nr:hypothetical protein [Gemmataceae bacterium]